MTFFRKTDTLAASSKARRAIDRHNLNSVVRPGDVITLGPASPKQKGRGASKVWAPQGILRACFGAAQTSPVPQKRRRITSKTQPKKVFSPLAASSRAIAAMLQASHSFVIQVET